MKSTAIVWSQTNCQYCDMAKGLLKQNGYEIEERKIGYGWTKQQLMEAVPTARSVPQIFIDGKLVPNGYTGLKEYLSD